MSIRPLMIILITVLVMTGCQLGTASQYANVNSPTDLTIVTLEPEPTITNELTVTPLPEIVAEPIDGVVVSLPAQSSAVAIESTEIDITEFVITTCKVQNPHWWSHVVVAGNTLTKIANQFNTTVHTLAIINCLVVQCHIRRDTVS